MFHDEDLNSLLFPQHPLDSGDDVVRLGRGRGLESGGVGHGGVHPADPDDRGVEVMEGGALADAGADLRPHPVLGPAPLHRHAVVGLLDALVDRVHVQGSDAAQVDHLTTDAELLELRRGVHGEPDPDAVADDGDVCAWPHYSGLANGEDEAWVEDLLVNVKVLAVSDLVLQEHNWVGIPDGGLQQTLAVLSVIGGQNLEM